MSDRDAILFANEAFYRAFADRDYKAMATLWSHTAPVTCLHPGWAALIGRNDVLESWRRILSHEASPQVTCRRAHADLHGEVAVVLCYEEIDGQLLAATNIFRREGRHWLMVHHQSGPTAAQLPPEDEDEEEAEPAPRPN